MKQDLFLTKICIVAFSFVTLCFVATHCLAAEQTETMQLREADQDSILMSTSFYFEVSQSAEIQKMNPGELQELLNALKANKDARIKITGWADPTGNYDINQPLSLARAITARDFLMEQGISSDNVSYAGMGVDYSVDRDKARRVTIEAFIPIEKLRPEPKPEPEPEPMPEPEPIVEAVSEYDSPFYIGVGVGSAFGHSTLASFGVDGVKNGTGFNVLGGYEFSKLIALELALNYTNICLGSSECCSDLYYADGDRYFAPPVGLTSYKYSTLSATSDILALTAQVKIDILSLFVDSQKWSAMILPRVGFGVSWSELSSDGVRLDSNTATHFLAGASLGSEYNVNSIWSLRLTTGLDYYTGKGFDTLPKTEHSTNLMWTTLASVIYKF